MQAVVEYVSGCCVFDGSPFKNVKGKGNALPQMLHMDVEYAKRIPVKKNPLDIGYVIADVLGERYYYSQQEREDCLYDKNNLPTR